MTDRVALTAVGGGGKIVGKERKNMKNRCDLCMYAADTLGNCKKEEKDFRRFMCCRYPPVPLSDASKEADAWEDDLFFSQPPVIGMNWCGEFKRRK